MARQATVIEQHSISSLLDTAYSVTEELTGELQDWYDNLPEGLQGGDLGDRLQDAISNLEEATSSDCQSDLPDALSERTVGMAARKAKRRESRRDRNNYSIECLQAALDAIEGFVQEEQDRVQALNDEKAEGADDVEVADWVDEVETTIEYINDTISALENVEFPGMFGK